ncbi:uncharacterized protein ABDE67_000718 [Symphorus nematophorus]
MELKRRIGDEMSLALLILGNIATAIALSGVGNTVVQNLDCTNDMGSLIVCELEAQNCTEYSLTLQSTDDKNDKVNGEFKQCESGCCCLFTNMILIDGESHNATVWRGGESMGSKIFSVRANLKPRVPTNISVTESNGNFQVKWNSNYDDYMNNYFDANVTYHKKGDTKKVSQLVKPTTLDGLNYYEILGKHLEPSTTYMVSVESYSNWSGRYSDSSEEKEFRTSASPDAMLLAVTISLSVAAVIISGAIYGFYVKLKRMWWDTVAKCQSPKLLDIHPSKQEVLKPAPLMLSTVCVEPLLPDDSKPWLKGLLTDTSSGSLQQSSGISTGSSCLSYANTEPADIIAGVQDALGKAFANISPISPLTTTPLTELNKDSGLLSASYNLCGVTTEDTSSGSSGFVNRTYSILIPNLPHQITTEGCEVQTQGEMLCESAYHPSEGNVVICADQQVPACPLLTLPPVISSPVSTDMSYQQCNADSGRFSCAEDSSTSCSSSGTNTIASCDPVSRVDPWCESSDELVGGAAKLNGKTEEAMICDENPCYGCVPAGSHNFPPVDNDYQAFQNLVEQPDILFSEKTADDEEKHLDKCPEESFNKMPESFFSPVVPGFITNFQGDQVPSELQRPFLSLTPAGQSMAVITDSGYQSV